VAEQVAATAEQASVTADRLETSERERGSVFFGVCSRADRVGFAGRGPKASGRKSRGGTSFEMEAVSLGAGLSDAIPPIR
jgi:hypothetical protein